MLELVNFDCQKSYDYYVQILRQKDDNNHTFLQLKSKDAILLAKVHPIVSNIGVLASFLPQHRMLYELALGLNQLRNHEGTQVLGGDE